MRSRRASWKNEALSWNKIKFCREKSREGDQIPAGLAEDFLIAETWPGASGVWGQRRGHLALPKEGLSWRRKGEETLETHSKQRLSKALQKEETGSPLPALEPAIRRRLPA